MSSIQFYFGFFEFFLTLLSPLIIIEFHESNDIKLGYFLSNHTSYNIIDQAICITFYQLAL